MLAPKRNFTAESKVNRATKSYVLKSGCSMAYSISEGTPEHQRHILRLAGLWRGIMLLQCADRKGQSR